MNNEKNILALCKKLPFWEKLSPEEKEAVSRTAVLRSYQKGESVFGCQDSCLGLILVSSGVLRAYLLSEEGREVTLFRLEKEEVCVLSASCVLQQITFETQLVTEQDCALLILGAGLLKELMDKNIYLRCFVYELITKRFSSVMWTMQQILFARFDRRLATFLLAEEKRTGNRKISMTHEEIAQQVSSAREVVARMLKRFTAEGWVEVRRGEMLLLDREALGSL